MSTRPATTRPRSTPWPRRRSCWASSSAAAARPPAATRARRGRAAAWGEPAVRLLLPLLDCRRGRLRLGERARHGAGRRGELLLVGLGLLGLAAGPLLALGHHRPPVRGLSRALSRPAVGRPPTGTARPPLA